MSNVVNSKCKYLTLSNVIVARKYFNQIVFISSNVFQAMYFKKMHYYYFLSAIINYIII